MPVDQIFCTLFISLLQELCKEFETFPFYVSYFLPVLYKLIQRFLDFSGFVRFIRLSKRSENVLQQFLCSKKFREVLNSSRILWGNKNSEIFSLRYKGFKTDILIFQDKIIYLGMKNLIDN